MSHTRVISCHTSHPSYPSLRLPTTNTDFAKIYNVHLFLFFRSIGQPRKLVAAVPIRQVYRALHFKNKFNMCCLATTFLGHRLLLFGTSRFGTERQLQKHILEGTSWNVCPKCSQCFFLCLYDLVFRIF